MTLNEAEDLAARILEAMDGGGLHSCLECPDTQAADRKRVASDLAGLRRHDKCGSGVGYCDDGGHAGEVPPWDCADGTDYREGLLRTAALYDVRA